VFPFIASPVFWFTGFEGSTVRDSPFSVLVVCLFVRFGVEGKPQRGLQLALGRGQLPKHTLPRGACKASRWPPDASREQQQLPGVRVRKKEKKKTLHQTANPATASTQHRCHLGSLLAFRFKASPPSNIPYAPWGPGPSGISVVPIFLPLPWRLF